MRWDHPQFGLLGPGAFLPLAEQTGLMRPLTLRVLDDALAQCARVARRGPATCRSPSTSAPRTCSTSACPATSTTLLAKWDVDPSMLQLEITETIVAADPVRVIEIMNRLGELGISLSLDDFGTGSSLAGLPARAARPGAQDRQVLHPRHGRGRARRPRSSQTIVDLAHNLGLRAVGEGIETEEAYRLLADCGCDYGQGFLMGRPMPAAELAELALGAPARF